MEINPLKTVSNSSGDLNSKVVLPGTLGNNSPFDSPLALRSSASSAIAFIDTSVSDYQSLIGSIGSSAKVYTLDANKDAVTQISEVLLAKQGISSLHIISHGESGSLQLGAGKLDWSNIGNYTNKNFLQAWSKALTADADILLYGCNVAKDEQGKEFVKLFSHLTSADVAASDDLTGAAALGGNWKLEYETGSIETPQIIQPWMQNAYRNILATYTVSNINDSGAGSLRDAINQANNNPGADTIVFDSIFNDSTPDTIRLNSQLIINDNVTIQGSGQNLLKISGDANGNSVNDTGDVRIFFVNQGIVNISNLTLSGGRGQGGNGVGGGGGGLGAGGAIFINGVTGEGIIPTQVMINNVSFANNQAVGGNGGGLGERTGSGGGFGGNGSARSGGGGGFAGAGGEADPNWSTSSGGNGGVGGSGGFFGNTGGARGSGGYNIGDPAGNGGNGGYGGGGGGGGYNGNGPEGGGGNGGDFGGGGGSGRIGMTSYAGSVRAPGGNGGFGGGGGASADGQGGNGGLGGGGGNGRIGGTGGLFGGNSNPSNGFGGNGAGLGGAIFVRSGSLELSGTSFISNLAVTGSAPQTGQGKGGAIFVNSGATLRATTPITYSNNRAANSGLIANDNDNIYILNEVSISSIDNTVLESPSSPGLFRISRVGINGDLTVNFARNGQASSSFDYNLTTVGGMTISGNSIVIPNGQSFVDVVVRPLFDNLPEGTENVTLDLVSSANYVITNGSATVSIADELTVSVTAQDNSAVEVTGNTATFRISRNDNQGNLTVNFGFGGNASTTSDYTLSIDGRSISNLPNNTVVIADGQTFVDIVVTPVQDGLREATETVRLNLLSGSYSIGNASAVVNITDVPVINIEAQDTDAVELTASPGAFRIYRNDTNGEQVVNFTLGGNANSSDYTLTVGGGVRLTSNSVVIANGQSFVDVNVIPVRDSQLEGSEAVILNLSPSTGYIVGNGSATVNVTDLPVVSITRQDTDAVEATRGAASFRISRNDTIGNLTVNIAYGGNASFSTDYTFSVDARITDGRSIVIPNGQSFVDVVLTPVSDSQQEGREVVSAQLLFSSSYIMGDSNAIVNITDVPAVSVTALDAETIEETRNTARFRIFRNDTIGEQRIHFMLDGTVSPSDYTLSIPGNNINTNSVVIGNGQSFVDIIVTPNPDSTLESIETLILNLLPSSTFPSYIIDNAMATVNITDVPVLSIAALDGSAVETTGNLGLFRISRNDTRDDWTVNFGSSGSANNSDYSLSVNGASISNSVFIPRGESFVDIVVTPIRDTQQEGIETVTLHLAPSSRYLLSNTNAIVNITDVPVVSISTQDADVIESTGNVGIYRISRNDTLGELKVNLSRTGNASVGIDYTLSVGGQPISGDSITILDGQNFVDVVVTPVQDSLVEPREAVILNLASSPEYIIGNSNATVTISDLQIVNIEALDADAVESTGNTGTYRISRNDTRGNLTVNLTYSGSASFSGDYNLRVNGVTITSNSLVIPDGQSFVDVVITPTRDGLSEGTETAILNLERSGNYIVGSSNATVNVTDVPLVSVSAVDAHAVENTSNTATFRIFRSDINGDTWVDFNRGGTANSSDYTLFVDGKSLTSNSIFIANGRSFVDVLVAPTRDTQLETTEAITLNLVSTGSNYIVGNAIATVNITDVPVVSVVAQDANAVEATGNTGTYRISRNDTTGDLMVNFALSGNVNSSDYTLSVGGQVLSSNTINSFIIRNGESFIDVVVTPTRDFQSEGLEIATLNLIASSNYLPGNESATVNITDTPVVSIAAQDADAIEITDNTSILRATRNDTNGEQLVNFTLGGSANTSDYILSVEGRVITSNSFVFRNGESFVDIVVTPTKDGQQEGTETLTFNLSPSSNYVIGNTNATVNITDVPIVSIAAQDTEAVEATGKTGVFKFLRNDTVGDLLIRFMPGGNAISSDYTLSIAGRVISDGFIIPDGQSFVDVVVTPTRDSQQEGSEAVTLNLMSSSDYVISNANATVSITDVPVVSVTTQDAEAVELTGSTGLFRISRNDTAGDLMVNFALSGDATSSDYSLSIGGRPVTNNFVISNGQSFVDVVVAPTRDSLQESREAVTLNLLSSGGYVTGNTNATVNITDVPVVSIATRDADAVEVTGNTGVFRISRNDTMGDLMVNFAPSGNAASTMDYTLSVAGRVLTSNSLVIPNGQAFVDVVLTPTRDSIQEGMESATLNLMPSTGYVFVDANATVNITDIPVVSVTAQDADAIEVTRNTGTYRISRNDTNGDLIVNFLLGGNANSSEYTLTVGGRVLTSNSLVIPNGQSFVDVVVIPVQDGLQEGTETAILSLMSSAGYVVGNSSSATVNIADLPAVSITALDADATEVRGNTGTYRISRNDTSGDMTVNFILSGTASTTDYTLNLGGMGMPGNRVLIPNGQSFVDVVIIPTLDGFQEGMESVLLNLAPGNYAISSATSAIINIADAPVVSIAARDSDATELSGNTGTYRISRNGTNGDLTVNLNRGGTATNGTDYTLSVNGTTLTGDSVIIRDGQEFVDVIVTPTFDRQIEGVEAVTLGLSSLPGNYGVGSSSGIVNITDAPVVSVTAIDADATETAGNVGTYRISRNGTVGNLTVNFTRSGTATSATDYTFRVGGSVINGDSVVIPDGQEFIDVTLVSLDDTRYEGSETVQLGIAEGNYAVVTANSNATVTITDNDNPKWQTVVAEDFNSDQKQDLLQRDPDNEIVRIWRLNSNNVGETLALPTMGSSWEVAAITDFNRDNIKDIFWYNMSTGENRIWQMGASSPQVINLPTVNSNNSNKIEHIGDFDGDGDADILWRNYSTGEITLREMNNINFVRDVSLPVVSDNNFQIQLVADFDGDRDLDILWYNRANGYTGIWEMNGLSLSRGVTLSETIDTNIKIAHIGNFDGDRDLDILWYNQTNGFTAIWEMDGMSLNRGIVLPTVSDTNIRIKNVTDFDGDGDLDILWYNQTNGLTAIWEMQNMNINSGVVLGLVSDTNIQIQSIADFDDDGDLDFLWYNQTNGFTAMWQMNGVDLSNGVVLPTQDTSFQVSLVGDINGDGKLDVVWYSSTSSTTKIWLTDGTDRVGDEIIVPNS